MSDAQAVESLCRRLGDVRLVCSQRRSGPMWWLTVTLAGRLHCVAGAALPWVVDAAHEAADRAGVPR